MLVERQSSGDESASRTPNLGAKPPHDYQRANSQPSRGENHKTYCNSEKFCQDTDRTSIPSSKGKPLAPSDCPHYTRIPCSLDLSSRSKRNTCRLNSPRHRQQNLRCVHSDGSKVKLVYKDGDIQVRKVQSANARLNESVAVRKTQTLGDGIGAVREHRRNIGFDFKAGERPKCGCYTCRGGALKKHIIDESTNRLNENKISGLTAKKVDSQSSTTTEEGTRRIKSSRMATPSSHQRGKPMNTQSYHNYNRSNREELERNICEGTECNKCNIVGQRSGKANVNVNCRQRHTSRTSKDHWNTSILMGNGSKMSSRNMTDEDMLESEKLKCQQKTSGSNVRRSNSNIASSTQTNQFWDRRRKRVRISSNPIYLQSPVHSPRCREQASPMFPKDFIGPSILRVKESNQSLRSVSSQSTLYSKDSSDSIPHVTGSSSIDSTSNNEAVLPHNVPSSISVSATNSCRSNRNFQGNSEDAQTKGEKSRVNRSKNYHSDSEVLNASRILKNSSESATNLQKQCSETQVGYYNMVNSMTRNSLSSLLSKPPQKVRSGTSLIPVLIAGGSSCQKPLNACQNSEEVVSCSKLIGKQQVLQSVKGLGIRCKRESLEKCTTNVTNAIRVTDASNFLVSMEVRQNVGKIAIERELKKSERLSECNKETKVVRVVANTNADLEKDFAEAVSTVKDTLPKQISQQFLNSGSVLSPDLSQSPEHILAIDNSPTDQAADTSANSNDQILDDSAQPKVVPSLNYKSNRAVTMISHVVNWINSNVAAGHITPRDENVEHIQGCSQIEDLIFASIQGWDVARFVDGEGFASVLFPCEPTDMDTPSTCEEVHASFNSDPSSTNEVPDGVVENGTNVTNESKTNPGKKEAVQMLHCTVIDIEDTLFTRRLTAQFDEAVNEENSEAELEKIRDLLCRLPAENMYVLEWLITRHVIRLENCEQFGQLLKINSKVLTRLVELGDTVFDECF